MIDSYVIIAILLVGVGALSGAGLLAAGLLPDGMSSAERIVEVEGTLIRLMWLLAAWLYFAGSESSRKQATLGKWAVGIVVTDLSGRRLSFGRASWRFFAKCANAFTMFIGFLSVAFTKDKLGLHDLLANTVVVRRRSNASPGTFIAFCLASVWVVFATVATPALLRARISRNEAAAIESLQAISALQKSYASRCQGYAPSLPLLGAATHLRPDLTALETTIKTGYRLTVVRAFNSQIVPSPLSGCDGAVSGYFAQAVPYSSSTGVRFFATDARGIIYEDKDASFQAATPIR